MGLPITPIHAPSMGRFHVCTFRKYISTIYIGTKDGVVRDYKQKALVEKGIKYQLSVGSDCRNYFSKLRRK